MSPTTDKSKKRRQPPRLPDRTLWDVRPGQQVLSPEQTAERLGISRARFYEMLPYLLVEWGLKRVKVRNSWKYLESSVDKMLIRASNCETPICPPELMVEAREVPDGD